MKLEIGHGASTDNWARRNFPKGQLPKKRCFSGVSKGSHSGATSHKIGRANITSSSVDGLPHGPWTGHSQVYIRVFCSAVSCSQLLIIKVCFRLRLHIRMAPFVDRKTMGNTMSVPLMVYKCFCDECCKFHSKSRVDDLFKQSTDRSSRREAEGTIRLQRVTII